MQTIYNGLKNIVKGEITDIDKDNFTIETLKGKSTDGIDLVDLFEKAKKQLATFNEGDEVNISFVMEKINK